MHIRNISKGGDTPSHSYRRLKLAAIIVVAVLVSLLVTKLLLHNRLLRPPYPTLGKHIAWFVGEPEPAYNFDVVTDSTVFRSSKPDPRFLEYLIKNYNIRDIISLAGPQPWQDQAKQLGLTIHKFNWSTSKLPPVDELQQVQDLLDDASPQHPVLIHCSAGADRTGYAIALYRVQTHDWPLAQAVDEMRDYWHFPETKIKLHKQMENYLTPPIETAQAKSPDPITP